MDSLHRLLRADTPEKLFTILQEKNRKTGLTVGQLMTAPMVASMPDMLLKIRKIQESGEQIAWLENWFEKGKSLLEGMLCSAVLGGEHSPGHNAYAIHMAVMLEVAQAAADTAMENAAFVLDRLHLFSLPVFNAKFPDKAINPSDGELYQELDRITLEQLVTLTKGSQKDAAGLLQSLSWRPLLRSGDEGRREINVREFLGMFFSGEFDLQAEESGQNR